MLGGGFMGIWSSPNGGAVCDPIGKTVRLETSRLIVVLEVEAVSVI